ncbi:MAG: hypothetical protein KJ550_12525 [Proteobacteria bacterium]|nr:hypothetical protein [Desulfobacteraceae bacterium]MBU4014269.1 hypothetical protein [Pseudomonadota bacterium]
MSRCLSDLQKCILKLAYKNQGSVLARDVLIEFYRFPVTTNDNIRDKNTGALIFNRKAIGKKRYQSASVSAARAFNRLVKRGLASRTLSGIVLTAKGTEISKIEKDEKDVA